MDEQEAKHKAELTQLKYENAEQVTRYQQQETQLQASQGEIFQLKSEKAQTQVRVRSLEDAVTNLTIQLSRLEQVEVEKNSLKQEVEGLRRKLKEEEEDKKQHAAAVDVGLFYNAPEDAEALYPVIRQVTLRTGLNLKIVDSCTTKVSFGLMFARLSTGRLENISREVYELAKKCTGGRVLVVVAHQAKAMNVISYNKGGQGWFQPEDVVQVLYFGKHNDLYEDADPIHMTQKAIDRIRSFFKPQARNFNTY